jgi:hypothetical protein
MFVEDPDTRKLFFNPDSLSLVPPIQNELVGSLIGLALYNSVIVDVNFPLAVYR